MMFLAASVITMPSADARSSASKKHTVRCIFNMFFYYSLLHLEIQWNYYTKNPKLHTKPLQRITLNTT